MENSTSAFWNLHLLLTLFHILIYAISVHVSNIKNINKKVHLTTVAILSCKGLSIPCIKQILICPTTLATATYLCNVDLVLWYPMTEYPKN